MFYTYYSAFLIFGHDLWAVHVFEILAMGLTSAGLMRLGCRRLESIPSGLISALFLPLVYLGFHDSGSQPEAFAYPFIIWGFALWPSPGESGRLPLKCLASGILMSIAVLFKSPMILAPAALLIDRLAIDRNRRSLIEKVRLTGLTAMGLLILPAWCCAYYALRGGWAEFIDANLRFPSKYAGPSIGALSLASIGPATGWVNWLVPKVATISAVFGILRAFLLRFSEALRWCIAFLAGWGTVIIQAKFWGYHHLAMVPYIAALLGLGFVSRDLFRSDWKEWRIRADFITSVLAGFFAGLGFLLFIQMRGGEWAAIGTVSTRKVAPGVPTIRPTEPTEADIARYIRALTGPEDRIYVFGDRALLYLLSDRRMAGPYPHLLPVLAWFLGSETDKRLAALIERLGRERPRLVILTPEILWWYGTRTPHSIMEERLDAHQFLIDGYRLAMTVGGYELWSTKE
ncbi:MAG TPA: glycosyltransferase family 39 protein [Planctomycetota bacterium]|nr:glycosyltransferase family 39 protein [Planctomycetota bacterium]